MGPDINPGKIGETILALTICAAPLAGIMFLAYRYVFKPLDNQIEFYQGISTRLQEYNDEQAYLKQQEQFRRESAGARDTTPKINNKRPLSPGRK